LGVLKVFPYLFTFIHLSHLTILTHNHDGGLSP
jgi:hypothetical protein